MQRSVATISRLGESPLAKTFAGTLRAGEFVSPA